MKTYCVYTFVNPDRTPFYVGVTCNFRRRMRNHANEIRLGNSLPKYNRMRQLTPDGTELMKFVDILEDGMGTPEEAFEKEVSTIASLRESGCRLKNLTDGGEGNINPTPEQIEKVRQAHLGKKRSEETRRRISEGRKGIVFSAGHLKNLSIARRKRVISQASRLKASRTSKGKINIKKYRLISPSGEEFITENGLSLFCEQHGLATGNMWNVLHGKRRHHKGWKMA